MDVPKDLIQPWKVTIQEEHSLALTGHMSPDWPAKAHRC